MFGTHSVMRLVVVACESHGDALSSCDNVAAPFAEQAESEHFMKLRVAHTCGTRFDITSGRHRIVTDQPVGDGGTDAGMSPVELFVGSLAGCVAYFVGRYCVRHQIPHEGFTVEAEWEMAEQPHRVGTVELALRLPTELTTSQQEKLLKVAHGCTVHRSLAVPPKVHIHLASLAGPIGQEQNKALAQ